MYEYEYIGKEQKLDILRMRKMINEADLYDFEIHLAELKMALIKDESQISEYTTRVNDKIAQNAMLDSLILELNS